MDCKVKCFPTDKVCCKCCCINISYYFLFCIGLLSSLGLHMFDVGSDFVVLIDLYHKNRDFYNCSIVIIALSFLFSSAITGANSSFEWRPDPSLTHTYPPVVRKRISATRRLFNAFLGFIQIGIIIEVYFSLKTGEKTFQYVGARLAEGIIESSSQSLFQIFVVLKDTKNLSIINLSTYYLSIGISLISIALSIIQFEIFSFDAQIKRELARFDGDKEQFRRMYNSLKINKLDKQEQIYICSQYGLVLLTYRFCEILSRVSFLSGLGYIYNGYWIISIIIIDLIVSTIFYLILKKRLLHADIFVRTRRNFKCSGFIIGNIVYILTYLLRQTTFLLGYWKPFSVFLPGEEIRRYRMGLSNIPDSYCDLFHWITKYITNIVASVLLITHIVNNNATEIFSIKIITYVGVGAFIISIVCLYYIILWNRTNTFRFNCYFINDRFFPKNKERNDKKFKIFNCLKKCVKPKIFKEDNEENQNTGELVNKVISNILGISNKSENKEKETKNIEMKENKIDDESNKIDVESNKIEYKDDNDLYEIKEEIKI